jgi:metal-dependent amidase/aminoacylase/carboxypeptidase family protein
VGEKARERMRAICEGIAAAHGCAVDVDIVVNYPVTFNHAEETDFAAEIAKGVAGDPNVAVGVPPVMGGEDFSYMLEARPGAFIFMGNGDTANLHNPNYDFNDEAIPHGVSYWVKLAETSLAA